MLTIKKALVKRIVLWVAAVFLFFSLIGFFVAPPVIRHYAIKYLSQYLERDVRIDKISVNPYTLSLTVRGFSVQEKGARGAFVSFKELYLNALSLSMVKEGIIFEQIRLNDPYVKINRNDDNSYNFSDIIEKATTPAVQAGETKKKSSPYKFSFNKISISNGSIDFWDGPNKKKHEVREFSLKVPFLSTLKRYTDSDVKPSLSAKVNGTPYVIEGKTRPFSDSLETSFDIRFTGLNVPYYLAYIPAKMNFSIPSGTFDAKIDFIFTQHKDKPSLFTLSGEMALKELVINDSGKKLLAKVPLMEVGVGSLEPLTGVVRLTRVVFASPEFYLARSKTGILNVEELFSPGKPVTIPKKKNEAATQSSAKKETEKLPVLAVDVLEVTDGKIVFKDTTPTGPVTIQTEKILLKAENVTTETQKKGTFKLDLVLNKRGTVAVTGEAGIDPLNIKAKTVLKNIGIVAFQPYFADKVRIDITSGRLNVDGDISILKHEGKDLSARFNGKTSVTRFASVDLEAAKDFLKWDSLYITNIDAVINPTSFTVKGVSLSNYFAHIIIHPDKTSNLQDIFVSEKKTVTENTADDELLSKRTEEKEKKKDGPIPVKIDRVTLQGGNVRFEDLSIRPQFKLSMNKLGGRITGLSSAVNTTADVDLKGTVGEYAPLEIAGRINPLKEDLYVDLKASMKGLELSPASTYSGKYLGYAIEKGTLSFDVEYKVDKRKLDSKHNVFLDQFTFGERVDSPDATKLPVRLAVALLKDRKGEIKLEIPVTGSLDDPQFSVWRIVIKILVNLLAKAATAPFALLGALFGGGEELGYVEFDPGSDVLAEANQKKIAALTKALSDRPSLKLDIAGHADLEKDREGIKRVTMTRKIKAQKLKDTARRGVTPPSLDEVTIEPQEYEKYLRRAYSAERFSKPRNIVGLQKTLPVSEMEKLMMTNVQVKEEDLRGLAAQRAIKVKEALLRAGVDPGRVFVLDVKSIAPEKKDKLKDSRVDFTLK